MIGHPNLKMWLRAENDYTDVTGNMSFTLGGTATYTNGKYGKAFSCPSMYLYQNTVPSFMYGTNATFSFCGWLLRNADTAEKDLITVGVSAGPLLRVETNYPSAGVTYWYYGNYSTKLTNTIAKDTPMFFCFSHGVGTGNCKLWINDSVVSSGNPNPVTTSPVGFALFSSGGSGNLWPGWGDELMLWNRALDLQDIKRIMALTSPLGR